MKRYPHFLEIAKGGRFPSRVVCLSADSRLNEQRSTGVYEREELERWSVSGCELRNGVPGSHWRAAGTLESELWGGVQRALQQPGQTLVVSYCCSRVWGLVGLWKRVESGEIDLIGVQHGPDSGDDSVSGVPGVRMDKPVHDGTDPAYKGVELPGVQSPRHSVQDVGAKGPGGRNARHGFAVLEDPPTILSARVPGSPGTLVLCDLRNWGELGYPVAMECNERSAWTLDTMLSLIELVRSRGWGSWRNTAGSQATHTFRHAYLGHAIHCHTHADALDLEASANYGGRCEARVIGQVHGTAYHLDFRSLYPSVCIGTRQPVRLIDCVTAEPAPVGWHCDWPDGMIACVTVETSEPAYPVRRDGLVIYPTGRFITVLAGRELADAERHGRIRAWHQYARYDTEPALGRYMADLYSVLHHCRDAGEWPRVAYIKTLLVCLPGKFGQHGGTWEPYPGAMPPCAWSSWSEVDKLGEVHKCRAIGWQCQREIKEDWNADAVPSLAAWVTSAGRHRLLQAIRCAGWHNVYYHDTDSLIVSQAGYDCLLVGNWIKTDTLGKLREIERGTNLEVMGYKHYRLCGKLRCSGLPKGTIEPSWDATMYWYRAWLKDAIRMRRTPRAERYLKQYHRSGTYKHGLVRSDGTVVPHRLQEG